MSPIIRRRCALCDDPLPDTNPTNTCTRCQEGDEDGQRRRVSVARAVFDRAHGLSERPNVTHFRAVPRDDFDQRVICPLCQRPAINRTAICHPRNPIGRCAFGLAGAHHVHCFCDCGAEVVLHPLETANERSELRIGRP